MNTTTESPILAYLLAVLGSIMAEALADPVVARKAAQQALEAYAPQTMQDLIMSGQILGFALSATENLRLAAAAAISTPMKLKLHGSARSLHKASGDAARLQTEIRQATPHPDWLDTSRDKAPPQANTKPESTKPARTWSSAMTSVADKLQSQTPSADPFQRTVNDLWIEALKTVAAENQQPRLNCESVRPPRLKDWRAPRPGRS